jgi:hypothetical protein
MKVLGTLRCIAVASLGALAWASTAGAQSVVLTGAAAALDINRPATAANTLPPSPSAKDSTIFGGAIRNIDPVQDEFQLNIYGQKPMKVLFDERTKLYRDGVRIPMHDLAPAQHASVQTALDGTSIFAISIHILSEAPKGDFRGRVLSYNPDSRILKIDAAPAPPFTVTVPAGATFQRVGQPSFASRPSGPSDLKPGSLVSVTFTTGGGHGVASKVLVYAVPGTTFIFSGSITALDTATGTMTLLDPLDQQSYQLRFYPGQILPSEPLHIGERVRVDATYEDGSYSAVDIKPY